MKQLELFYQEAQIHFLVHGTEQDVMINATEMAKAFGKRIDHFLKAGHTKKFITELESEFTPNGGNSCHQIISTRGQNGTYFCEELALKFAAWLDPKFELWVYRRIKEITFGPYRKHWEAQQAEEEAKKREKELESQLLSAPTPELMREYLQTRQRKEKAKNAKSQALRNQLNLFNK